MDIRYFIGVDISKATLDWAVFDGKTVLLQSQSANSEVGIKATLKLIKALPGFTIAGSVCCMEHTGIYKAHLLSYLRKISFPIWLENSLQIKKAGGLQRGKNDRTGGPAIDAQPVRRSDIAEYAFRFRDQMRLWQPPRPVLQKLAALSTLRQRLLLVRQQLQQPITEHYYKRKVGEGKNKMSALNAVRNKLIHRVCPVVHRSEKYDKNYTPVLA